ncbi:MAG: S9 family peptidase, partial [Anaerolineae bacterium]
WSPDGRSILFVSNRSHNPDLDYDATALYTIPAAGGDMQPLTAADCRKYAPAFSPDGRWISYLGREQTGKFYQNAVLYLLPAAGGEPRPLTTEFDLHLSSSTLNDIGGSPPLTRPTWTADGRVLLSQVTTHGDQPLYAFHLGDTVRAERLTGAGVAGQFSQSADGRQLAFFTAHQTDPGQVALLDRETGAVRTLTQFNEWLAAVDLGRIEEVTFPGGDGAERQGWVLTPPGFDPAQIYPAIIEIHGGPQTQYGRFFMHEFHFLAAQGYVVAWSNPRGSQGYGEAFAGAIHNRWGTVDYDDVMAWTDHVAALPYVDADRMGVTGGSYGGYMTSLIIGKTDRFKAAVAQRVVSNMVSFYGSSDLNIMSEHLFGQESPPWDDWARYWEHSPMRFIGNAVTPTLIIHSEQDLRCPHEQGEQVFVALRRKGVDTELVLFPEESHGLSRNGRTDRRIVRLEHMARWFARYL